MEQRNNLLIALVALIALVVGIFVGINLQGSGLQGKLALTKDKPGECEEIKSMYYQGTLTANLGSEKAASDRVKYCGKTYPAFWNAFPTTQDCLDLKNREIALGSAGALSDFLRKKNISMTNIIYCGYNFQFLWYGNTASISECWAYKSMYDNGKWPNIFDNDKINKITKTCTRKVVGWAPAINVDEKTCETYKIYLEQGSLSEMILNGQANAQIVFSCSTNYPGLWYSSTKINADNCIQHKKYYDQGILTDMINQGKASMEIAKACDTTFKYIWNGVSEAECKQFKEWQKQMILTNQLGSIQKASDATAACWYYGYDLFN